MSDAEERYSLVFYVPIADAHKVKQAVFAAGAGKIGNYEQCCWETQGVGQFLPLQGSNPNIGVHDSLETVDELRIELICEQQHLQNVVTALKASHPYETPAYHCIKLNSI
jgi:hypothetical protein